MSNTTSLSKRLSGVYSKLSLISPRRTNRSTHSVVELNNDFEDITITIDDVYKRVKTLFPNITVPEVVYLINYELKMIKSNKQHDLRKYKLKDWSGLTDINYKTIRRLTGQARRHMAYVEIKELMKQNVNTYSRLRVSKRRTRNNHPSNAHVVSRKVKEYLFPKTSKGGKTRRTKKTRKNKTRKV